MRAYEYSVTPEASAQDGMVSIASLSGYIVNAAHRTMIEEGYDDCLLSRCGFEIDERPHTGETITITVNSGLNNIVTLLNRTVSIIDSEGNEIGRGRIEWMMPRSQQRSIRAENPSHLTRRYINRFHEILPDIGYSTGLQIRIDMDFKGIPFGPMPALCAIADDVTKVHAICVKCGNLAYVSHRTVQNDKRVLLGETQEYEPLCRECYQKALQEEKVKG